MEAMSDPYSAPQSIPQPNAGLPAVEPGSIKVFGILHIVFGCIGAFGFLASLAQYLFKDALMKLSAGGDPEMFELQKNLNEVSFIPSMVSLATGLVVTVLILRAGTKLLKKKRDAVKASALYSYASIGAKVLTMVLALVVTLPALNELFDQMAANSGGASASMTSMISTMKTTMAISSVASPILLCIYPVLSLVMLKKKKIADYLSEYGK